MNFFLVVSVICFSSLLHSMDNWHLTIALNDNTSIKMNQSEFLDLAEASKLFVDGRRQVGFFDKNQNLALNVSRSQWKSFSELADLLLIQESGQGDLEESYLFGQEKSIKSHIKAEISNKTLEQLVGIVKVSSFLSVNEIYDPTFELIEEVLRAEVMADLKKYLEPGVANKRIIALELKTSDKEKLKARINGAIAEYRLSSN